MIMRLFFIFGLVLLGGTGYFIVVENPPTVQATPAVGEIVRLREEGIIPEGDLYENEEIEHEIFGVPPEDEERIAAAMEGMDMDMGGMEMGGMDMETGGQMEMAEGEPMDMDMDGDGQMDMAAADMPAEGGTDMENDGQMEMAEGEPMDMDGDGQMDMAAADMPAEGAMDMEADGEMDMAGDQPMNMDGNGQMDMAEEEDEDHADEASEEEAERLMAGRMAGLVITEEGDFDREITLSMSEWTFSDLEIDAQAGERIRFTLKNDGQILHEFMFMSMAAMQGVNYRAKRADWNLLEHEALYEKSLLLPGDEITFVAQVLRPGAWMFMCMLPYHMQMGMMGQMATEGMAMEM